MFAFPDNNRRYSPGDVILENRRREFSRRFTKQEINNDGYKTALFDANIISNWSGGWENNELHKLDYILESLANQKIRPVLTSFLIVELLWGVPSSQDKLAAKKKYIARFLKKLKPLWLIEPQYIKALEYLNYVSDKHAHEYLRVFSNHRLGISKANMIGRTFVQEYDCDIGFYNRLQVHEEAIQSGGCLEADFSSIINYELDETKMIWGEGTENNVNSTNEIKAVLQRIKNRASFVDIVDGYSTQQIIAKFLLPNTVSNATAEKIITDASCAQAPLHCVINAIYHNVALIHGYKQRTMKKNGKWKREGAREFTDHQHAAIALSYCDYFFTDEKTLRTKSAEIKEKLNLKCRIGNYKDGQILDLV